MINAEVGVIVLKPKAWADNTDTRFDNSRYHAKTEFSCFIIHF